MKFRTPTSHKTAGLLVAGAAAVVCIPLISAAAASDDSAGSSADKAAHESLHSRLKTGDTYVSETGNKIEVVDPGKSTYVPNIADASKRSIAKAQRLLTGANKFCKTHDATNIMRNWRAGGMGGKSGMGMMMHMKGMSHMKGMEHSHYFNPNASQGLHPRNPIAALIYKGKVGGIMLNADPLPYLGTIPRGHTHAGMMQGNRVEMVHVYCTNNIKDAFTPSRQLGVMTDTKTLRNKIRPAVMDLSRHQLHEVLDLVHKYTGHDKGGPDPQLQAMRIEIRHALMKLNEHQLRSVWNLMQSY